MIKQSRTRSALGGKKKESKGTRVPKATKDAIDRAIKKHVHRMHISKTDNGKFLVDHDFKSLPGEPPVDSEQHAIEPGDLSAHVGEHLGIEQPPVLPPAAAPVAPQPTSTVSGV